LGKGGCYHAVMKADLRISVKDLNRGKHLKILLTRAPFTPRQYFVTMNGGRWPQSGQPVSLTRVVTAVRKALVRAVTARA